MTGKDATEDYPLIKTVWLRRIVEYLAILLLIVTIVVGASGQPEGLVMIVLGAFLIVWAFAISGIRGAFARSLPWMPVRPAARVIMVGVGVLSMVLGIIRLHGH